MDHIGHIESLENDIKLVTKTLGFNSELIKANQSKRKDFRSYYTSEMVDRVTSAYERDISLFGYKFE